MLIMCRMFMRDWAKVTVHLCWLTSCLQVRRGSKVFFCLVSGSMGLPILLLTLALLMLALLVVRLTVQALLTLLGLPMQPLVSLSLSCL